MLCILHCAAGAAWKAEERLRELASQIADLVPELPHAHPLTQVLLVDEGARVLW